MTDQFVRSRSGWRPIAGASLLLVCAVVWRVSAQTTASSGPPQTPAQSTATQKTTAGGVYSAEQAKRGEASFGSICLGCHTLSSFSNTKFRETWNGRPLVELVAQIVDTMPEDAPGSLPESEYAQIVAYILKVNRAPDGKDELPLDPEHLKQIVIAFAPSFDRED